MVVKYALNFLKLHGYFALRPHFRDSREEAGHETQTKSIFKKKKNQSEPSN